jgi:MFS family permease
MLGSLRQRVSDSLSNLRSVWSEPNLRRVELGWLATMLGGWMTPVVVAVFVYREGGAEAVALSAIVATVPAALLSPVSGAIADRYPRERVMLAANLTAAAMVAAVAVAVWREGPYGLVIALSAAAVVCESAFRPAQAALLPSLVESPEQLTAANAVATMIESIGIFVGPALAGALLAVTPTAVPIVVAAALLLVSTAAIAGVSARHEPRAEPEPDQETTAADAESGLLGETLEGLRTSAFDRGARLLIATFGAQTMVNGVLNVLLVVTAARIFDGDGGLGVLFAMIGLGGVLGAAGAPGLGGSGRLAPALTAGVFLWGLPIALLGAWLAPVSALVLMAVIGLGNTLADVAGLTLLQRAVPDRLLGRVMGTLEMVALASVAMGSLLAPLLLELVGLRVALALTGTALVAFALSSARALARVEANAPAPVRQLSLLRENPIFFPLPSSVTERLAGRLVPVELAAGQRLFAQGEEGLHLYLIESGQLSVTVDGREVRRQGPGEGLGEIALLRDVPRTATAEALEDSHLWALGREDFLEAIGAHARGAAEAERVVAGRLAHARPGMASI